MEQIRYTIVIEDGKLAGISQHNGNLDAVPLSLAELVAVVPSINAAALAEKEELETSNAAALSIAADELAKAQEYIARVQAAKTAIVDAIKNPDVDTDAAVIAIMAEAEKPEAEKIREEKLAQLEALKAELGIE